MLARPLRQAALRRHLIAGALTAVLGGWVFGWSSPAEAAWTADPVRITSSSTQADSASNARGGVFTTTVTDDSGDAEATTTRNGAGSGVGGSATYVFERIYSCGDGDGQLQVSVKGEANATASGNPSVDGGVTAKGYSKVTPDVTGATPAEITASIDCPAGGMPDSRFPDTHELTWSRILTERLNRVTVSVQATSTVTTGENAGGSAHGHGVTRYLTNP